MCGAGALWSLKGTTAARSTGRAGVEVKEGKICWGKGAEGRKKSEGQGKERKGARMK